MPSARILVSTNTDVFGEPTYSTNQRPKVSAGCRLDGRLVVSPDLLLSGRVDVIEISFKGKVQTLIGSRKAVEDLIFLTIAKEPGDFQNDAHPGGEVGARFVDFFFDIPYTKTASSSQQATSSQSLPSSTLVQASKYITKHTALSDRQAIQGICDVCYQVGAKFLLQGLTTFQTYRPVELLSLPDPQGSPCSSMPAKVHLSLARTAILHRPWRRGNGDLWISVLEPAPLIWTSGAQRTYAVDLCIKLSLHESPKSALGPIECSVQARWEAITMFSVVTESNHHSVAGLSDSSLTMSKTVVLKSQATKLLFPPWYQIAAEDSEYPKSAISFLDGTTDGIDYPEAAGAKDIQATTKTTLTLVTPQLFMGFGCSSDLMCMKYVIHVILGVRDPGSSGRNLSSVFRIPVSISSSEKRSTTLTQESHSTQCVCHEEAEDLEPPQYVL